MKTNKNKPKNEKIPRRALRKNLSFRRALSKAWDVERPPESYYQALEETYSKLTDGPISRKRPLHNLFRGAATLAAACVALCIILVGINATEPELIEGLPGVGVLFRQFNGNRWQDTLPPVSVKVESTDALPVADNGTILQKIEIDGTTLRLTAQVPYMGRKSYLPISYYDSTPLGTYGVLGGSRLVDGESSVAFETEFSAVHTEVQGEGSSLEDTESSSACAYSTEEELTEEDLTVTWTFSNVDMNQENVVFTLYDWDGKLSDSKVSLEEPRVTAEFVIALHTRTACSSDNYQSRGLQKVTPEECRNMLEMMAAQYAEGWHVGNMETIAVGDDSFACRRIDLFCSTDWEGSALPYVDIACFSKGKDRPNRKISLNWQYWYQLETVKLWELQAQEGAMEWSAHGDGFFVAKEETDPVRTGRKYSHFAIVLPVKIVSGKVGLGEDIILYGNENFFSLWNSNTEEVLVEDLAKELQQDREKLTQVYSSRRSSSEDVSYTVEWPWE